MKKTLLILIVILLMTLVSACNQSDYNAYVVSSEWRSAPIINSATGEAVGQAYQGFAVAISDVREQKAYFQLRISDPSIPNITTKVELYIPIDYMVKADIKEQNVPAIISLDTITISPLASFRLYDEAVLKPVARFYSEIGPIQFIQNVKGGYMFLLGMNLVWVGEQDIRLIKYVD